MKVSIPFSPEMADYANVKYPLIKTPRNYEINIAKIYLSE